jgi:hypothetical protein
MLWHRVRFALLAGVLASGAVVTARADEGGQPAGSPAAPPVAHSAPCTRTVTCTEWVPEQYPCTRTVYKTEYKQETYTAYRCESIPETKTYTCTVYKQVPEVRTETRMVCVTVPTVEERTCMQTFVTCKPVTHIVRKCVDKGHYECREVPCAPKHHWLKKLCSRHHDDCCEPCCPPPTKIVKVWVPCPVWIETPVTRMERVCETRPVTVKVTVCKTHWQPQQYQVTCLKCVPEQVTRTCQVMTTRMVPYQATRCVAVCVPHQETVMATRMVARTVVKEVPVAPCCETVCCKTHGHGHHRSAGLHFRHSCDCN